MLEVGTSENPRQVPTIKVAKKGKAGDFSAFDDLLASTGIVVRSPMSSPFKVTCPGGRLRRGIHYSETVALQANQVLRDANTPSVLEMTSKRVGDSLDAVRKRLVPEAY